MVEREDMQALAVGDDAPSTTYHAGDGATTARATEIASSTDPGDRADDGTDTACAIETASITGQPHAACLVGIIPTKDLCGAVFTSENPNPHLVSIPVSDRNLKVLNRMKLPRCTSFSCYL